MEKVYLYREAPPFGRYNIREVEDRHLPHYNAEGRKFTCSTCKKKVDIICTKRAPKDFCPFCIDKKLDEMIAPWKDKKRSPGMKNIPSWRLDLDDATPEQILNRSSDEFKVPYKSHSEWKEFYNQPHELKKQRAAEQERKRESERLLRSLG